MKLPRSVVDAYNRAVKEFGDNAEAAARKALNAWLELNPGATIEQVRNASIAIMSDLGTMYGRKAGDAAYAMRDMAARAADVELPDSQYDYEPDMEYVEKTAHYQVGKLIEGDRAGFVDQIADATRYFAERGANDTTYNVGKADAKALGKRVRWARVPTGATTCPYCLMLASRGFVYRAEAKALNANHRHCDCRIIEGFDGMEVEGYDPDLYYDMWKNPEKYAQQGGQVDIEQAIKDYTHGMYEGVVGYSDLKHAGESMWETRLFRDKQSDFAKRWGESVTEEEKATSEAIYRRIMGSKASRRTIMRTERDMSGYYPTKEGQMYGGGRSERFGKTPNVGDVLNFGIKSASKDVDFATKIARDEISGMGNPYGTVAETGSEVLAYRVRNATRYLDISRYSDYADQEEVLFAGRYRIAKVTIEEVEVGGGAPVQKAATPREYAQHEGLEIEYFTSKKGVEMARFGTRTYPVDKLDQPSSLMIEVSAEPQKVKVKYVDLEEL